MNFLDKIQNLPERARKTILWAIIIILGATLLFFWIRNSSRAFQRLRGAKVIEFFNAPDFKSKLDELPKIEIPEIKEETIRE